MKQIASPQEAYDRIRAHFTQPAAMFAVDDVSCRYRTADGRACAVGCLIPDELYEERFDFGYDLDPELGPSYTVEQIMEALPQLFYQFYKGSNPALRGFLEAAQNAHDTCAFESKTLEDFITRLDHLALGYGLRVPGPQ